MSNSTKEYAKNNMLKNSIEFEGKTYYFSEEDIKIECQKNNDNIIKINITNAICDDDELEKIPAEINHFDQVNSIRGGIGSTGLSPMRNIPKGYYRLEFEVDLKKTYKTINKYEYKNYTQ